MKKELKDCMTSELLFQAMKENCNEEEKKSYIDEYEKRLRMMELSDEQIAGFRQLDETAINNGCYMLKEILLTSKPMITSSSTLDSIKLENCTLSELVYLTDDANAAAVRDHEWLPKEAWALVCEYALRGKAKAEYERQERMEKMGITKEQGNIFVRNECKIAQRIRWKMTNDLAW